MDYCSICNTQLQMKQFEKHLERTHQLTFDRYIFSERVVVFSDNIIWCSPGIYTHASHVVMC